MKKPIFFIMRINLLTFILIILCSCTRKSTNEKNNTNPVLEIDLLSEPGSTVTKLSDFAANVEYIPLQTSESSLMREFIPKIVNKNKRIYIQNRDEILSFDMNGKFLFKLNKSGRGPEEYTNIEDFDVSSDNKILTILSSLNHKLIAYAISDIGFTFQRSITLKDPSPYLESMVPKTDNVFLAIPPWRGTEPTLSLLINTYGDTIHFKPNCYKFKMARKANSWVLNDMLVYSVGNVVCFKERFSDTVLYVDHKDNFFKPQMIFNSHGTLCTPEMRGGSEKVADNTTYVPYILETSRYIFYWYFKGEPLNGILFDKSTKTKLKLDIQNDLKVTVTDDLRGGPDFNIEYINKNYCSGGKLFSFVEAISLKKYVDRKDFKDTQVSESKKEEIKKLADSLKETDNPVLIIVTPKE